MRCQAPQEDARCVRRVGYNEAGQSGPDRWAWWRGRLAAGRAGRYGSLNTLTENSRNSAAEWGLTRKPQVTMPLGSAGSLDGGGQKSAASGQRTEVSGQRPDAVDDGARGTGWEGEAPAEPIPGQGRPAKHAKGRESRELDETTDDTDEDRGSEARRHGERGEQGGRSGSQEARRLGLRLGAPNSWLAASRLRLLPLSLYHATTLSLLVVRR